MRKRRIRGFTIVELLIVIAVITILLAFALPALMRARSSARRAQCINNMHQITLALEQYQMQHRMYPRGRQPFNGFSARVAILPDLEEAPLFNSINFDWPYAHVSNETVRRTQLSIFVCPENRSAQGEGDYGKANYLFTAGTGLRPDSDAFPDDLKLAPDDIDPSNLQFGQDGVFWSGEEMISGSGIRDAQVMHSAIQRDGLSHTVAVSETVVGGAGLANDPLLRVKVVDPTDLDPINPRLTDDLCADPDATDVGTRGGRWVAGDYNYGVYNHYYPPNSEQLDCVSPIDPNDLDMIDPSQRPLFDPYYIRARSTARSLHPGGGVVISFFDGTTTYKTGIDLNIWRALATRSGQETIPDNF